MRLTRCGSIRLSGEALPITLSLLVWLSPQVKIIAPLARGDFNIEDTDQILDSRGAPPATLPLYTHYFRSMPYTYD